MTLIRSLINQVKKSKPKASSTTMKKVNSSGKQRAVVKSKKAQRVNQKKN